MKLDVLIFGGGVAGLWILDRLRREGYDVLLLEAKGIGAGQSGWSQGIIHGGGKYALRGVRDFAAVEAIKHMPDRWRAALAGQPRPGDPDLSAGAVLSPECLMWLPSSSLVARLQALVGMGIVAQAGLLATRPVPVPRAEWPAALAAAAVYTMAEPVMDVRSVLMALASAHPGRVLGFEPGSIYPETPGDWSTIQVASGPGGEVITLSPKLTIFAAGNGNRALLDQRQQPTPRMQVRPLRMLMLEGPLPWWHGHCVVGGKTCLTITARPLSPLGADGKPKPGDRVAWQVGGNIAEHLSGRDEAAMASPETRAEIARELRRWLPGLPLDEVRWASYDAPRAEGYREDALRPSGVHLSEAGVRALACWPTKLALAPLLADDVLERCRSEIGEPVGLGSFRPPDWPAAPEAPYPWETCAWQPLQ